MLRHEQANVSAPTPVGFVGPAIEATVRVRLGQFRALFSRQAVAGRAVLATLLRGPVVCRPVEVEGPRGVAITLRQKRRSRVSTISLG